MNEQLSDRELDALVAERVMGWTHWRGDAGVFFLNPSVTEGNSSVRGYIESGKFVQVASGNEENAPHYSADISAAMEVVEKMRERDARIWFTCCFANNGGWVAGFEWGTGNDANISIVNDSLPRAICEAALAAINGDDPKT